MEETDVILKGLKVIGETATIEEGYVWISQGTIKEMGSVADLAAPQDLLTYTFSKTCTLVPGMIDVHIHGASGADTMDATFEALDTIASTLPKEGTTSFLATTITQSTEAIEKALKNVADYIEAGQKSDHAEIVGVHLEGPFISKKKAGAQPLDHIAKPDHAQFDRFQALSGHRIKLITMAPEEEEGLELSRYLSQNGVVVSIGHSNATYQQVDEAIKAGASHVTHLYNGMSGLHHREPGVVGATLLRDELMAELIVDGIHTRPEVIDLTFQQKGKDQLVLITDAMRAKCLKDGTYDLGGQPVFVKDGKAVLENGSLAGSVLRMVDGFKNMLRFTKATIEEVVQMTSTNPAKELGIFDRKGSLAAGKEADLVVLDETQNVVMTFCKGIKAYAQGKEDLK